MTDQWRWGGDDPDLLKQSKFYAHAILVPGYGWFGGFPPEVAKRIVDAVNRAPTEDTMGLR